MALTGRNIVVIGTSAGGLDVLDNLLDQLPTKLPASLFIVQHMAPGLSGIAVVHRLARHKAFMPKLAEQGETFQRGRVYVAPPDAHLLVKKTNLLVTKGARENHTRPAIDPLFRSAAVAHGSRVIGVVLSGLLDDGTAGLMAVKRCGGVAVVQDPKDAAYSSMPQSAVDNVAVDHCVPIAEMGALLTTLIAAPHGRSKKAPHDIRTEALIAERVLSDVQQVESLGIQVPYNCPECGGVLWQLETPGKPRYRCHTGHSFTRSTLLEIQTEKIEETLWVSLRMFEERRNLLTSLVKTQPKGAMRTSYVERLNETAEHIERIRAMLLKPGIAS